MGIRQSNVWTVEEKEWLFDNMDGYTLNQLRVKYKKEFDKNRAAKTIEKMINKLKTGEEITSKFKEVSLENIYNKENYINRKLKEDMDVKLKDFSFLVEGEIYQIKEDKEIKEYIFDYMDDFKLFFKSKAGFIASFPRHLNMTKIYKDGRCLNKIIRVNLRKDRWEWNRK